MHRYQTTWAVSLQPYHLELPFAPLEGEEDNVDQQLPPSRSGLGVEALCEPTPPQSAG